MRIFGLYSNVLEDPGVISGQTGSTSPNKILDSRQIAFLTATIWNGPPLGRRIVLSSLPVAANWMRGCS